ncbi:Palmitoyltransferase [Physocladia obscura]|uniref:Palmitoyltransferase n=1 Tax=Physocladia obscura TaxID=109957 RepID=A0AAD5SY15_9FUNG|nr:Palmitoyltransferase [Physocladia obscura]
MLAGGQPTENVGNSSLDSARVTSFQIQMNGGGIITTEVLDPPGINDTDISVRSANFCNTLAAVKDLRRLHCVYILFPSGSDIQDEDWNELGDLLHPLALQQVLRVPVITKADSLNQENRNKPLAEKLTAAFGQQTLFVGEERLDAIVSHLISLSSHCPVALIELDSRLERLCVLRDNLKSLDLKIKSILADCYALAAIDDIQSRINECSNGIRHLKHLRNEKHHPPDLQERIDDVERDSVQMEMRGSVPAAVGFMFLIPVLTVCGLQMTQLPLGLHFELQLFAFFVANMWMNYFLVHFTNPGNINRLKNHKSSCKAACRTCVLATNLAMLQTDFDDKNCRTIICRAKPALTPYVLFPEYVIGKPEGIYLDFIPLPLNLSAKMYPLCAFHVTRICPLNFGDDTEFEKRNCKHCKFAKPYRSGHCKTCETCYWIGNCVGNHNQAHFIRFLIATILSLLYNLIVIIIPRADILFLTYTVQLAIVFIPNLVLNATRKEMARFPKQLRSAFSPSVWTSPKLPRHLHDLGIVANISVVMGANQWLWLIPKFVPHENGIFFRTNAPPLNAAASDVILLKRQKAAIMWYSR